MHETLSKFIEGKEKFDLILSSQKSSLNKNGLEFKKNKNPSNGIHN